MMWVVLKPCFPSNKELDQTAMTKQLRKPKNFLSILLFEIATIDPIGQGMDQQSRDSLHSYYSSRERTCLQNFVREQHLLSSSFSLLCSMTACFVGQLLPYFNHLSSKCYQPKPSRTYLTTSKESFHRNSYHHYCMDQFVPGMNQFSKLLNYLSRLNCHSYWQLCCPQKRSVSLQLKNY